jgi:ADP-ribose pyrophosphatase
MKEFSAYFKAKDLKIIKKENKYSGFCQVDLYTLQTKLFAGGWTTPYQREVVNRYQAVAALPYDPVRDQVVLIEQFRIGALPEESPWMFEVVAGIKDKGHEESYQDLLRREIKEEAGLDALELVEICDYYSSPGATSEKVKIFCAIVDATKAPAFSGVGAEHEDIKVHVISAEKSFLALEKNLINNAATIIALQWLKINQQKFKNKF